MKKSYVSLFLILLLTGCGGKQPASVSSSDQYIKIQNGQFMLHGKPWYFIGTNFWYGPILGSTGHFGDRERLIEELDLMKENGITNLRVLVGADGPDNIAFRTTPTLQTTPGVYKENLLDGLDFFMNELSKRNMYAVLYLTNNWDWSGGYVQYLDWCGYGTPPVPNVDGWNSFSNYLSEIYSCDTCTILLKKHIKHILSRTNYYNQRKYTEDPHIMSWQIANEPRPMGAHNKELYEAWIKDMAVYIKSLDPNHLVSTGSEGEMGSENDFDLYTRIHSDPNIDYLTIHTWPKNWNWLDGKNISESMSHIIQQTDLYLDKHVSLATVLSKPIVLEEFGLPRDNHEYTFTDPTQYRDTYYSHIFKRLLDSADNNTVFAGCNFWGWGGLACSASNHVNWQIGDDYTGDPGQEEQGLNSVFASDSTLSIISSYTSQIKQQK